ncbi:MAG TPA: PE-PPE domain-containing protein [Mycobacterium sp.]|nr:PE-PPE domain-containing protein [Mycobacterium sp.]
MKSIARSLIVVLVALVAVPALVVTATITTAVQLLAVTGLYMGGTEHPLGPPDSPGFVEEYMNLADANYIGPATGETPSTRVAVVYPAQFFPVFGSTTFDESVDAGRDNLNSCIRSAPCNGSDPIEMGPEDTFVVFGYSQSAVVASLVKRDLIEHPTTEVGTAPDSAEFVLLSNPMRPNGGILGRGFEGLTIPILGITFYGATPTNSCQKPGDPCYPTTDIAYQYDLLGGDAPAVPWNVLAWANSAAAYYYLHGDAPNQSLDGAVYQGTTGDTDYYLLTSDVLPLLMPLEQVGVPKPILLVANAPLKVLIEAGYYREPGPGEKVPFQLLPEKDPITLVVNLAKSVPVGIDDGLDEAGVGRALGTDPVTSPYGVGGRELPPEPDENLTANAALEGSPAPEGAAAPQPDPTPVQPLAGGGTEKTIPDLHLSKPGNDLRQLGNEDISTPDTPPATTPRPLQIVRDSLSFEPKPPAATRPSGDGPLKRIVNALTGQRPDAAADSDAGDESKDAA